MGKRERVVSTRLNDREHAIVDAATALAGHVCRADWMRAVLRRAAYEALRKAEPGSDMAAAGGEK